MATPAISNLQLMPKAERSKAPVFAIGCSRSGTTLLYHMLLSSGNFAVYRTESWAFTLLEPGFRPLHRVANKRKLLDAWYQTRLYTKSGLTPEEIEPRIMQECRNGGDFLRITMEEMCRKQGVERWAETTPEHLLYIRRIKETIPNALVIHVIRDGRDVALSWEKINQLRRLPWDRKRAAMAAAIYWEWIVEKGRAAGQELGQDYIEIHYEDLVLRPREVLRKLEPFVEHDLNYDRITQNAIGSVGAPNTAFKNDERNPIGRWKRDFTPEELTTVEELIGPSLTKLGYERQGKGTMSRRSLSLGAMRFAYRRYFDAKLFAKTRTPLGKWFVTRDWSWI